MRIHGHHHPPQPGVQKDLSSQSIGPFGAGVPGQLQLDGGLAPDLAGMLSGFGPGGLCGNPLALAMQPQQLMASLFGMGPGEMSEALGGQLPGVMALPPEQVQNLQRAVIAMLREYLQRMAQGAPSGPGPSAPVPSAPNAPYAPSAPAPIAAPPSGAPPAGAPEVNGPTAPANLDQTAPGSPQRIVALANADEGKVSDHVYDGAEYQGWQYLQKVIDQAQTGPAGADGKHHPPGNKLPDEAVRTHPRPVWRDKDGNVHHTDWCGLWATKMFQDAGVNCYWQAGEGLKGDVKKVYSPKKEDVRVGDIIVGGPPNWHHAIVTGIKQDAQGKVTGFETMNGNHPGIARGEMQARDVRALYRPTTPATNVAPPAP